MRADSSSELGEQHPFSCPGSPDLGRSHPRLSAPWPDEALQLDRCVQPAEAAAQDAHPGAAALAHARSASARRGRASCEQPAAACRSTGCPAAATSPIDIADACRAWLQAANAGTGAQGGEVPPPLSPAQPQGGAPPNKVTISPATRFQRALRLPPSLRERAALGTAPLKRATPPGEAAAARAMAYDRPIRRDTRPKGDTRGEACRVACWGLLRVPKATKWHRGGRDSATDRLHGAMC